MCRCISIRLTRTAWSLGSRIWMCTILLLEVKALRFRPKIPSPTHLPWHTIIQQWWQSQCSVDLACSLHLESFQILSIHRLKVTGSTWRYQSVWPSVHRSSGYDSIPYSLFSNLTDGRIVCVMILIRGIERLIYHRHFHCRMGIAGWTCHFCLRCQSIRRRGPPMERTIRTRHWICKSK